MRKNIIHFFVFYCVLILLSGCGVKANFEEKASPTLNYNNSTESLDHLFFGAWIIKEDFKLGTVSIYDEKDIKSLLGKRVDYSIKYSQFDQKKLENPFYKKTVVSNEDFLIHHNVLLKNLDITQDDVTMIEVYTDSGLKEYWNEIGATFYLTNSNEIIVFDNGTFFKMEKAK
ncbi:hypothetical protein ABEW34_11855 [Paenibacillus algorifonticola]|uniref:hypothetical protein n=1 Tax=Paenibacillus algorifonticola TaxID=684063 RepID=UPI003D277DD0